MQEVIIRKAFPEDAEALNEVMLVISEQPCNMTGLPEMIAKIADDEDKYLLAALEKETGKLIGSLFGVIFEDICGDGRPILLIENVAVLDEFQNKGVGRQMFDAIERWAAEKSCHYEILVSGLNRKAAHEFYRKLGFGEGKGFKKYLR